MTVLEEKEGAPPDATVAGDVATTSTGAQTAPPGLSARLLTKRTLISFGVAIVVGLLAVWRANIDWAQLWARIRGADLRLYVLAVVVFYLSFVLRAIRWKILLRNAGEHCHVVPLGEIIIASFFLNCVVPAKMGDVYRGFQLRSREGVGVSKGLGTIIAERLIDLFVLMSLLVITGFAIFHNRVPSTLVPYAVVGGALCVVAVAALTAMRMGRGHRLLRLLPEPLLQRYEDFRTGTVQSLGRWSEVIPLSVAIWGLEGSRLALVVFALGFGGLMSPPTFLLVALVAALLTTVPFTPGGLGLVEGGMVVVLSTVASVPTSDGLPIALLDRSISYGSILVFGFVIFALSHARAPHPARVARDAA